MLLEVLLSSLFELWFSSLRTVKQEQLQQQHQQKQQAFDPWSEASGEFGGVSNCCCCCRLLLFWLFVLLVLFALLLLLVLVLLLLFALNRFVAVLTSLAFDEFSLFECVLIVLLFLWLVRMRPETTTWWCLRNAKSTNDSATRMQSLILLDEDVDDNKNLDALFSLRSNSLFINFCLFL